MTTLTASPQRVLGYEDLPGLIARMTGDEKHHASAHSTLDVLWVLYDRVLRVDPANPRHPDRDRFLLSKGHGPHATFATLAAKGFFDPAALDTFGDARSPFGHHPDRMLVPGIEISSGSLGHGFPMAIGVTLALRAQGRTAPRVFCLVGDGELDEGSNHEAIAVAGRLGLASLRAIVVDNRSSSHGWPGGLGERFAVEGWAVETVDGHDHDALARTLSAPAEGRPRAVVAEVEAE